MDVPAHEHAVVRERALANRFGADVLVTGRQQVERSPRRRRVHEQHVALRHDARADLVLAPFVGEPETLRPGTADAGDTHTGDVEHAMVRVARVREVGQVVITRHERERNSATLDALDELIDRREVARVALGRSPRDVREVVRTEVPHEQDPVDARFDRSREHAVEQPPRRVHVADHREQDVVARFHRPAHPTDMAAPAGYSGTPLDKKLGIASGCVLALRGDPAGLRTIESCLPDGVERLGARSRAEFDVGVCAVRERAVLAREFAALAARTKTAGMLWIAWPKKTSTLAGDLDENVVRAIGLEHGLVDVKVCAIDVDWSGLKFVRRLADRPKPSGTSRARAGSKGAKETPKRRP